VASAAGFVDSSAETAGKAAGWLNLRHLEGLEGLGAVYEDVCAGRMPPEDGLIVGM